MTQKLKPSSEIKTMSDYIEQCKKANELERALRKKARGGLATSRKREGQTGIRLPNSR